MIWLTAICGPEQVAKGVEGLQLLPTHLRPLHFSENEDGTEGGGKVDDEAALRQFLGRHREGFFLRGDGLLYSFDTPSGADRASIDLFAQQELSSADVKTIFTALVVAGAWFGFAASEEEYRHRNKVSVKLGGGMVEAWVGRDIERYLPGLYWMTLLSKRHCAKVGVDLPALLSADWLEHDTISDDLELVQSCERAADWESVASTVDALCEHFTGFFSVRSVQPELERVSDLVTMKRILSHWK